MIAFLSRRLASPARAAALLAAVACLSASCIKADIGINVKADGTGSISFLTAMDSTVTQQLTSAFGGAASPASDFTNVDQSKLPPGSKVTPYTEGKFKGEQVTTPFTSIDQVGPLIEQISAADGSSTDTSSSPASNVFQAFSLKQSGNAWTFEASVSPPFSDQGADSLGLTQDQLKAFFKDASFTIRLKLPGSLVSNNADSVRNGEMTWNLDLFATKPRDLSARSLGGKQSSFPIIPVAALAAVAVAAILAVVIIRRSRGVGVSV